MVFITPKFVLALIAPLVLVGAISIDKVNGARECGRTSPSSMAFKLAPCASAARDADAQVSSQCCSQVETIFTTQSPGCLCAVLLSNMAKLAGIKPEIAITIPQRCNLADRPVGYKCGAYTLP